MRKPLIYSIWISLIITVFSSFLLNKHIPGEFSFIKFTLESSPEMKYWGYPLGWLKQEAGVKAPKLLVWENFLLDIIIWTLIAFLILHIFIPTGM